MNLVIDYENKNQNMMKKIVFSKLSKYGAYYKIGIVHFQNKKVWKHLHEERVR
jgi:hypothetical protein